MKRTPKSREREGGRRHPDGRPFPTGRRIARPFVLAALLAVQLLAPGATRAASIALTTTLEGQIRGDRLEVDLTILNEGDEAASALRPELRFAGGVVRGEPIPELQPGASSRTELSLPAANVGPGVWPYRLDVAYTDGTGAKLHALHVATVRVGEPPEDDLEVVAVEAPTLSGTATVRCEIANRHDAEARMDIDLELPRGLTVGRQPGSVILAAGETRAVGIPVRNQSARPGSRLAAFFVVRWEAGGFHHSIVTPTVIEVAETTPRLLVWRRPLWLLAAGLLLAWLAYSVRWRNLPRPAPGRSRRLLRNAFDAGVLLTALGFIASYFPASALLAATTTSGGDMASHYFTAAYLRDVALPRGRLLVWCPGNYAGFPLLQFYFPLTFALMVALSAAMPLQVAFKLMTILGTLLLPVCAYLALRLLDTPFPGPALGALGSLCFLFHEANSMWGGNLASTLAGEFTFSLGLALALLFVGTLRRTIRTGRGAPANGLLVALIGLSHGYALLWAGLVSLLELVSARTWWRRLGALCRIHGLAILLLAFWLLPLLWYLPWTTAFSPVWHISGWRQILPEILWPAVLIALVTSTLELLRSWRQGRLFPRALAVWWGAIGLSFFFYLTARSFHVVDIRFLPFLQIAICLLAAAGLAQLLWRLPAPEVPTLAALLLALPFVQSHVDFVPDWIRWNYSGFEAKAGWPELAAISQHLAGDWSDPRVAWEHSPEHEALGTIRAFESLPLFSGRSTLEGVYMQATSTAPFIFYTQSEISKITSCPFPQWGCTSLDLARGVEHLQLFNVSQLILRSPEARLAAAEEPGLELETSFGEYEIHRVLEGGDGYATPLGLRPALVRARHWKVAAYQWYKQASADGPIPVFDTDPSAAEEGLFAAVFDELPSELPRSPYASRPVLRESVDSDRITVDGCVRGQPVLVRISYHPRWRATTGERIWLAGPGLMLVYPRGERFELVFGTGPVLVAGRVASAAGLVILLISLLPPGRRMLERGSRSPALLACLRPASPIVGAIRAVGEWPVARRRHLLWAGCGLAALVLAGLALAGRIPDPEALVRRGQEQLDAGRHAAAAETFRRAHELAPQSRSAHEARFGEALAYYESGRWRSAEAALLELTEKLPGAPNVAESLYLVGQCRHQLGETAGAVAAWREVERRFPDSEWAVYARQRLASADPGREGG